MTDATFTNITTIAAILGHFKWAENFIDTNAVYLHQEIINTAVSFAKATSYFSPKTV